MCNLFLWLSEYVAQFDSETATGKRAVVFRYYGGIGHILYLARYVEPLVKETVLKAQVKGQAARYAAFLVLGKLKVIEILLDE